MVQSKNPWKTLGVIGMVGVISILVAKDWRAVCLLMLLSYSHNASYSMVSRSAVRDSALYHAFTMLLSNILWYSTLHVLVGDNMTLALFVPYTVATVWGSFTGATASMKIEERFGITTDADKKVASAASKLAERVLLGFLAGFVAAIAIYSRSNIKQIFMIAALVFVSSVAFSLLRRSRNTSSAAYHIIAFTINSTIWYLLWRDLALSGMTFALFVPYCLGSVSGGVVGQQISAWIERKIGAKADAHLSEDAPKFSWQEIFGFVPWRAVLVLSLSAAALVAFSKNAHALGYLALFSAAQQAAFSMVSRSRNRDNMAYHVIASIFSNGVWFLTFRQLQVQNWTLGSYFPYTTGGAVGSLVGVGTSMAIEKNLNIASNIASKPKVPKVKVPDVKVLDTRPSEVKA